MNVFFLFWFIFYNPGKFGLQEHISWSERKHMWEVVCERNKLSEPQPQTLDRGSLNSPLKQHDKQTPANAMWLVTFNSPSVSVYPTSRSLVT